MADIFGATKRIASSGASATAMAASKKASMFQTDKGFSFPSDLSADYCFQIDTMETTYKRSNGNGASKGKLASPINSYFLPIPAAIADNIGINYSTVELGAIGGKMAGLVGDLANQMSGAQTAEGMGKSLAVGVSAMAKSGFKSLVESSGTDKLAGLNAVATQLGVSDKVTGVAGLMLGQVPNPHVTAFFKGVGLKEHAFSWDLWPQSQVEAIKLESMVNMLRRDSLPSRVPGGISLTYPYEAHCKLITKGNTLTVMFKPAFIKNISLNYSPQGPAFLEDGHAAGLTLSISLQETDVWLREDYPEGVELSSGAKASGEAFKGMGSPML